MQLEKIAKEEVFRITKEHIEKKFGKDSVDFTDAEEEFYNGYTAGMLKGLRMAGVEVLDL